MPLRETGQAHGKPGNTAIGTSRAVHGATPSMGVRRRHVIDTARIRVSPLGLVALAGILVLAVLAGIALSHQARATPMIIASPAAITGEPA